MVGNHSLPAGVLQGCDEGITYCLSIWANDVTFGLFWVFALLGFSAILFMATARLGNVRAYGYASFVGMLGSVWLVTMGLMMWEIASAFIIAGVIGIAVMVMNER